MLSTSEVRSKAKGRLEELVALSRRFGEDPQFARGGGGNSSVKVDGVLYIKASGTSLAALTPESVIALEIAPLTKLLNSSPEREVAGGTDEVMEVATGARIGIADDRRPSVELLFHSLLPEAFVLHTHPTTVNAVTCAERGAEISGRLFGPTVLWIAYADPGLPLARSIRDARVDYERRTGTTAPRAMFLQNHGLIMTGDSRAEIETTSAALIGAIQAHLASLPPVSWGNVVRLGDAESQSARNALGAVLRSLLATADRPKVVLFDDSPTAILLACSELGRALARCGPLTPDQIVYAGSFPLLLTMPETATPDEIVDALAGSVTERAATEAGVPPVVIVPGLGFFAVGDSYSQAETVRQVFGDAMDVTIQAHRLGGARPLADAERQFIERWEAEAYRRRVAYATPVA